MSELLGTTIEELIATMKERRVRIPSEIGAFIALEVCEALAHGPAAVRPADVRIAEDGTIGVFAPPGSATITSALSTLTWLRLRASAPSAPLSGRCVRIGISTCGFG